MRNLGKYEHTTKKTYIIRSTAHKSEPKANILFAIILILVLKNKRLTRNFLIRIWKFAFY